MATPPKWPNNACLAVLVSAAGEGRQGAGRAGAAPQLESTAPQLERAAPQLDVLAPRS